MKERELPVAAAADNFVPALDNTSVYSWYMQPTYTPATACEVHMKLHHSSCIEAICVLQVVCTCLRAK